MLRVFCYVSNVTLCVLSIHPDHHFWQCLITGNKRWNDAGTVVELFSINIQQSLSLECKCVYFMLITVSVVHLWWIRSPSVVTTTFCQTEWMSPGERESDAQEKYSSQMFWLIIYLSLCFAICLSFFIYLCYVNPLCPQLNESVRILSQSLPLPYPLIVSLFPLLIYFFLSLPLFFLSGVCFFSAQSPRLMLPWRRQLLHAVCTPPDSLAWV